MIRKKLLVLPRSKKLWAATLCALPVLIASSVIATAQVSKPEFTYNVYTGGIHVVDGGMNISMNKGRYVAEFGARTHGILGRLAPWNGVFATKGWVVGNQFKPEEHTSIATWRKEVEEKTYSYGKDGSFKKLKVIDKGVDETPAKLEPALVQQTTDILSAAMSVMHDIKLGKTCNHKSEIFDGDRRFRLTFRDQGTEQLARTRLNSYAGVARKCEVEVTPITGKWHDKPRGWLSIQEQGRKKGELPVLWFGQNDDVKVAFPVKLKVTSDYGVLFMHVADYPGAPPVTR